MRARRQNWAKITAGELAIGTIRRFSTHGLKTRIAGTIDFVEVKPFSSTTLAERLETSSRRPSANRDWTEKAIFLARPFLGLAPVEVEWPQREEIARASGEAGSIDYDILLRTSGGGRFAQVHTRYLFGSVADHLCAIYGTKGSPISRGRPPARPAQQSSSASRQFGVERPTPRYA